MPTFMLHATREALGADAALCSSRSLFIDKFADPTAKDDGQSTPRKNWFNVLINKPAQRSAVSDWYPKGAKIVHARLQSRLMLNMAGGVMENAGLLLDRYGLPYIPGSASKACARRMALQALHDWVEAKSERPSSEDICAPCCAEFKSPAEMLSAIALVFGWVKDDWILSKKDELFKSDFAWAVFGDGTILQAARDSLHQAENFAGTIAFLPAHPNADPGLEIDVVTCHHGNYYSSSDQHAEATDTEEPVPVIFPAIKSQTGTANYFTFPLLPLRNAHAKHIEHAHTWLANGLEIFGLGAKTNAGYGWFTDLTAELKQRDIQRLADKFKEAERILKEEEVKIKLTTVKADSGIADALRDKPKDQLRGILNKFEFDNERFWPQQEPESTYEFQVTLLELHLEDSTLLTEALTAKKAKKALQNLAKKFNRQLP